FHNNWIQIIFYDALIDYFVDECLEPATRHGEQALGNWLSAGCITSALRMTARRVVATTPVSAAGTTKSIRAAPSDFGARRLLLQSARHRRQRAPGIDPTLVASLERYQACPLSKPGIDLCTPDFRSRSARY